MVDVADKVEAPSIFSSLLKVEPLGCLTEVERQFDTRFQVIGGLPFRLASAAYRNPRRASQCDLFEYASGSSIINIAHHRGSGETARIREALADVIPNYECFHWNVLSASEFEHGVALANRGASIPALNISLSTDANIGWVDPLDGLEDIYRKHYRVLLDHPVRPIRTAEEQVHLLLVAITYLQMLSLDQLSKDEWNAQPHVNLIQTLLYNFGAASLKSAIHATGASESFRSAMNSLIASINDLTTLEQLGLEEFAPFVRPRLPLVAPELRNLLEKQEACALSEQPAIWPSYIWSRKAPSGMTLIQSDFLKVESFNGTREFCEMAELRAREREGFGYAISEWDVGQRVLMGSPSITVAFGVQSRETDIQYVNGIPTRSVRGEFAFLTVWIPNLAFDGITDRDISVLVYVISPEPAMIALPYSVTTQPFFYDSNGCTKVSIRINLEELGRIEFTEDYQSRVYRLKVGLIVEASK